MAGRLGELLVSAGVLSAAQVDEALAAQRERGRPFGLICEQLFGVAPSVIEEAWAQQYATLTRTVDPTREVVDDRAVELISRRQAWQFRVLPMRFDQEELLVATTGLHLRRALRFATNVVPVPVFLVLADPLRLGEMLCRLYPLPGLGPESVDEGLEEYLIRTAG